MSPLVPGDSYTQMESSEGSRKQQKSQKYERYLSPNELSYYLPTRGVTSATIKGTNDMYLQMGIRAKHGYINQNRIIAAFAILRMRDPQSAAELKMEIGQYSGAKYSYTAPSSPEQALADARASIDFRTGWTPKEAVSEYLNGERWLSDKTPFRLVIVEQIPGEEYLFMFCLTHWLMDGIATLLTVRSFLDIFAQTGVSDAELLAQVESEWATRWGGPRMSTSQVLPPPGEARLPLPKNKLHAAATYFETHSHNQRYIGGHVFPRKPNTVRRNVIREWIFTQEETKQMVARCRRERVTLIQVVFALCNVAWIRTMPYVPNASPKMPMMVYSSLNSRPYEVRLPSPITKSESYISLSYYNIVLPTLFPKDLASQKLVFWSRCRQARDQTRKISKSSLLPQRSRVMNDERAKRAILFAQMDDEEAGLVPPGTRSSSSSANPSAQKGPSVNPFASTRPDAPPSLPLLGVSTVNDLDAVYRREKYPDIQLTTMNVGTRKAKGACLMYAYTWNGEFTLSLGWDEASLEAGTVDRWWTEMRAVAQQFLLDDIQTKL